MTAVFLMAAGKGTRLAPLTDVLPKPAIPVANEPVMGHLLRLLARQGYRDVVCNIAYKADVMRTVFGDGSAYGVNLVWSQEAEPLGTAGGLKNAQGLLPAGEPVVVLSGDGLHAADIVGLVRQHQERGAFATLGLTHVSDASEYGVAVLDDEGFVTGFQEKPAAGTEKSKLANTGIYVFDPAIFDLLPPAGEFYDFGENVFPRLLAEGRPILGVELPGYWNDVGGLEAMRQGNLDVVAGALGDGFLRDDALDEGVLVHPTAEVADDATLLAPVIVGSGAKVGAGARLSRAVVLPGATVPDGALLASATYGSTEGLLAWARSLDATPVSAS